MTKKKVPQVQNIFRSDSDYGRALDILIAHPQGLAKEKLISLLASDRNKSNQLAKYSAHVVLSAKSFEASRHRSCRKGFKIVQLKNGDLKVEIQRKK